MSSFLFAVLILNGVRNSTQQNNSMYENFEVCELTIPD